MQTIWYLMTNAHMEAWVWGPLMGAVVAMVFAGFSGPPGEGAPVTVIQTTRTFVTKKIVINNHHSNNGDSGGAGAIFIALFVATLFLAWKYVIYVELIRYALTAFITSILAFSITTAIFSIIKGQFNSSTWVVYVFGPMSILTACFVLLNLATDSLDPNLSTLAAQTTFIDFYMNKLSEYGRAVVLYQMLGMTIILLASSCTAVVLIHYLALMNQRSFTRVQPFWAWLARTTLFLSNKGWLVMTTILLIIAFILIEPTHMATWTTA